MDAFNDLSRRIWKPAPGLLLAGRRLLDLVLPPLDLDGAPAQSPGLPAKGWGDITFIADPVCDGCGAPQEYDLGEGVRCLACSGAKNAWNRARAACLYDEHSRELILRLKHGDQTDLSHLFARWLNRAGHDLIAQADVIVPVPLHRWRLLRRRYNQAAEIARPLARMAGLAHLPDTLVRKRPTASQGGRNAGGRRQNVAGAFAVPPGRARHVAGKAVLLIDDVLTTGATANACARALKAAGAKSVDVLVVAKVKAAANASI